MSFNAEQLAYAARAAIDFYLKNDPIDQINTDRPLIQKLMGEKQEYSGGLQYVVEQLRYQNDSNFQAYFGDGQVTYNRKRTLQQAKYTWASFHDGFGLNEDELAQNGITMTDDRGAEPTADEKVNLTNLLKENMDTLKLGFQEGFDKMLHRDGAQSTLEIPGLDALVSLAPSAGTVGTIAASNAWWRNYANASVNVTASEGLDDMETAWRECIRYGGKSPNFILAGSDFVDWYRGATTQVVNRQVILGSSAGVKNASSMDAGVGSGTSTGLYFKGVELVWDPVFDVLDTEDTPTVHWAKRCYMLNTQYLKLRPIKGHWMVARRPPRVYDRYVHYSALTAKAALTTGKRNAHAVLALA
jgi:hypothetical protein